MAGLVAVALAVAGVVGAVMLSGSDATAPIGAVAAVQDDHLSDGADRDDPGPPRPARGHRGHHDPRRPLLELGRRRAGPANATDPADPAYDFSRADTIMRGLADRGITPILSVYSTPAWSSGGAVDAIGGPINRLAPEPADYGEFMAAVATRYNGSLRRPRRGRPCPRCATTRSGTSPTSRASCSRPRRAAEARSTSTPTSCAPPTRRSRARTPAPQVIAGVGGPRSSTTPTGVGAIEWLRGLRERDVPLDAYSQHVYPAAAPTVETEVVPSWSSIGRVIDELDAWRADPAIPLYITEAGYTTAATRFRDTKVTEAQQAEYLTQIFSLPQLRTDRIKAVVWFNLQDNADWPAGLLRDVTLDPKPSYERFLQVVRDQEGARLE